MGARQNLALYYNIPEYPSWVASRQELFFVPFRISHPHYFITELKVYHLYDNVNTGDEGDNEDDDDDYSSGSIIINMMVDIIH